MQLRPLARSGYVHLARQCCNAHPWSSTQLNWYSCNPNNEKIVYKQHTTFSHHFGVNRRNVVLFYDFTVVGAIRARRLEALDRRLNDRLQFEQSCFQGATSKNLLSDTFAGHIAGCLKQFLSTLLCWRFFSWISTEKWIFHRNSESATTPTFFFLRNSYREWRQRLSAVPATFSKAKLSGVESGDNKGNYRMHQIFIYKRSAGVQPSKKKTGRLCWLLHSNKAAYYPPHQSIMILIQDKLRHKNGAYVFQRLQLLEPFLQFLYAQENFVSCTFGDFLKNMNGTFWSKLLKKQVLTLSSWKCKRANSRKRLLSRTGFWRSRNTYNYFCTSNTYQFLNHKTIAGKSLDLPASMTNINTDRLINILQMLSRREIRKN